MELQLQQARLTRRDEETHYDEHIDQEEGEVHEARRLSKSGPKLPFLMMLRMTLTVISGALNDILRCKAGRRQTGLCT